MTDSSVIGRGPVSEMRRVFTFKSQQSSPPKDEPSPKRESYPVYRLSWDSLKAYLEELFPGQEFRQEVSPTSYFSPSCDC